MAKNNRRQDWIPFGKENIEWSPVPYGLTLVLCICHLSLGLSRSTLGCEHTITSLFLIVRYTSYSQVGLAYRWRHIWDSVTCFGVLSLTFKMSLHVSVILPMLIVFVDIYWIVVIKCSYSEIYVCHTSCQPWPLGFPWPSINQWVLLYAQNHLTFEISDI
jgi:hypothetical protein